LFFPSSDGRCLDARLLLGASTANVIADNQGNPWATYGLNAWAGVNNGVVVPSTVVDVDGTTVLFTNGAVNNIVADFTYSTNAVPSPSAMQFGSAAPVTLSIASNRTITARGILVTADSGGGGILNSGSGGFIRPNRSTVANTSFNVIQNSGNDFTIGASITNGSSGAATQLVKSGAGRLILTNNNGYSGGTTINEGTIQVGDGNTTGGLTITSTGSVALAAANTYSGNMTVSGAHTISADLALASNTTFEIATSQAMTVSGQVSGTGSLTKTSGGTLVLSAANSYTGDTVINGGVVQFATGSIPSFSLTLDDGTLANTIVVAEGQSGTINLGGRVTMPGAVTGAGTLNYNVNYVRDDITGNWTGFTGTVNFGVNRASPYGTDGDFRMGNGNVSFANAKLYVGADVEVQQNYAPPSSGSLETIQLVGELSGDPLGNLSGNTVAGRFTNWTVGGLNTNSTYDGLITDWIGASRLTKTGTGTLTLTNASTYTGSTAVNQGTLLLTGNISTSSMTTLLTAGTLAGTGSVGALTIDAGGTVSTGDGIGTLNATLDATLARGATTTSRSAMRPAPLARIGTCCRPPGLSPSPPEARCRSCRMPG
jgi:fibronectin-binding autotransporter adhesin